jgi:hypothetical protein
VDIEHHELWTALAEQHGGPADRARLEHGVARAAEHPDAYEARALVVVDNQDATGCDFSH